jgi:hypothetical protein
LYFTQVGPLDPRAQKLPLPDDLMGELLAYVITHEVGHTLGFQHNFKASALYSVEKIRDPQWLKTMGHVSTLMDYSRFNYVAQPEDKIPPELLIPKIGPYDRLAVMCGYKPIPGATKPEDEKPTLAEWLKVQETTPYLRFSTARSSGADSGENTEAVGDGDAVQATTLGTKNLQRVMDMLLHAVPRPGTTQAVVINQDTSLNSALKPADRGEIITFFATGEGLTTPLCFDGALPEPGRWPAPVAGLSVTFGGVPGEVQFKGEIYSGVLQVNVKVPANAPAGNAVPLVLTVGGVSSPATPTLALR